MKFKHPYSQQEPSIATTTVTLSKYVLLLFIIIMPFVGGWIGYTYATEKTKSVESAEIVYKEILAQSATPNKEPNQSSAIGKSSFATTRYISEEQHIAMKIDEYSDKILNFYIVSHRKIGDDRLFVDYLHFNKDTGEISLIDYDYSGQKSKLFKLFKYHTTQDLETVVENIHLASWALDEATYTQKIKAGLSKNFPEEVIAVVDFRSFCNLHETRSDSNNEKKVYLSFDREKFGDYVLYDTSFGTAGPCSVGTVSVLDGLLVQNLVPTMDATQPKVRGRIYLDENTSYIHIGTGDTIYKYSFTNE